MRQLFAKLFVVAFVFCFVTSGGTAQGQAKRLAPGVLKVIPAEPDVRDSYSLPTVLPGLSVNSFDGNFVSDRDTLHGQTQNVVFFRDVWQYEFAFLGLRQLCYKQSNEFGHRNIWYLVYRVRNTGANLTYEEVKEDPRFTHLKSELKRNEDNYSRTEKFVPRFTLKGWVQKDIGVHEEVAYRDKISPRVLRKIQGVEDSRQRLLDTVEMMRTQLPVTKSANGAGAWGVAIWENVDPSIDHVSVDVNGVTNAFRLDRDTEGNITFRRKTLQLNFWRPGDGIAQHDDRIRYGIPLVDDFSRQIQICKRYHLPGPRINGYLVSEKADRNIQLVDLDAETSLTTLNSPIVDQISMAFDAARGGNAGAKNLTAKVKVPEQIRTAFAERGVAISEPATMLEIIPGKKWSFKSDDKIYEIVVEPQFWEPKFGGIRFIKSLDHVWVYR